MNTANQTETCAAINYSPGGRYRCSNRAKFGPYCGVHSPSERDRRAEARRPVRPSSATLRALHRYEQRKAALDRVLACAREIAEGPSSVNQNRALRVALSRYDAAKGE